MADRSASFVRMDLDDNAGSDPDTEQVSGILEDLSDRAKNGRLALQAYLDQIRTAHPEYDHPAVDFLDALLEDGMASARAATSAQHSPPVDAAAAAATAAAPAAAASAAAAPATLSPGEAAAMNAVAVLGQSVQEQIAAINAKLSVQDTKNFCQEVTSRQAVQDQRQKERKFWSNQFVQPAARFHALDLFDGQTDAIDLANHASLVAPPLAANFGASAPDSAGPVAYDPDTTCTYREMAPVWKLIERLLWNCDRRRHIQQVAGTSKLGYVTTYSHIHRKQDGNQSFSGSRTDREHWATERFDVEKEILKEKAHEKQMAGVSGTQSKKKGSKAPHTNTGPSNAGPSGSSMSNRQKHNKKQRKVWLERKKAKAAQAKADGTAAAKDADKSKQ